MLSSSQDSQNGTRSTADEIIVHSPIDGREVGRVPAMSRDQVQRIAQELRAAQPDWEALGTRGRAVHLNRWRDWLLDNDRRLTEIVQRETGKVLGDAAGVEVPTAVATLNYYVDRAQEFLADARPRPHTPMFATKKLRLRYRPYQLVGGITPWNVPLAMPAFDLIPALVAGCAVLSKPSEFTPLSWTAAVRGWEEVGNQPVLACAIGRGDVGAAVVDLVDMINFTGSTRTGRVIAQRAGERLIPCSLELGGKDPMIVLADADLERASSAAVYGAMWNGGQACVSVERVYVEESLYDAFVESVTRKVRALRQGPEQKPYSSDVGAMANEAQLQIVERHVDDAVAHGARALTGGQRRPGVGLYFEPTVLVDVDHSMECLRQETFGPTLPIIRVRDAEEAIRLSNDTPYGLSASVFSRDHERAERVAERLEAGAVNVNNVIVNGFQFPVPMGGWKESGIGARAGGAYGIRKFCRSQTIVSDRIEPAADVNWYPYTPLKGRIQERALRWFGARDLRRRLGLRPRRRAR
jgi:acyl-CoA reductase-like NAD-dependent aldehyde dehydrogenase